MSAAASVRVGFRVSGRVQGVSYRASAREVATRAGLRGWVRNDERGGEVEGVVEGEPAQVEAFLTWCARGPPGARVDTLTRVPVTSTEQYDGFAVR